MNNEVLNSWKEIAAYLGRGVRTVQRWEHDLALPVRRPRGRERSAVIALKPDLDKWLREVPQGSMPGPKPDPLRHEDLHRNTEELLQSTQQLLICSARIQEMVKSTMALTVQLKTQHAERIRERAERAKAKQLLPNQPTRVFPTTVKMDSQVVHGSGIDMLPGDKTFTSN